MEHYKIISPKTQRPIYVGGSAYKNLITKDNYTEEYLSSLPQIKPMSPKKVSTKNASKNISNKNISKNVSPENVSPENVSKKSSNKNVSKNISNKNVSPKNVSPKNVSKNVSNNNLLTMDTLREIMLNLDADGLGNICSTNINIRNVCIDKYFWTEKINVDNIMIPLWVDLAHMTPYKYKWLQIILNYDYFKRFNGRSTGGGGPIGKFKFNKGVTNIELIKSFLSKAEIPFDVMSVNIAGGNPTKLINVDMKYVSGIDFFIYVSQETGGKNRTLSFGLTIHPHQFTFKVTKNQINHFLYLLAEAHILSNDIMPGWSGY